MLTMPSGSFSTPFKRTCGAMISRFNRCLRSAFGVRRSMKVAMCQLLKRPARQGGPPTMKGVRVAGGLRSSGRCRRQLLLEVCQRHHTEVQVAPGAHGNGPVCLLLVAYDQDVRDLLHRMLADFIVDFLVAQIELRL